MGLYDSQPSGASGVIGSLASAGLGAALAPATGGISLIPSIIGAGGSLLSGLLGWKSAKDTNAMQMKLAQMQNQFQLDAMRENNEFNRKMAFDMFDYEANYNTPLAQMQRLKEAGLHPSVAYAGHLGSSGNISASAPTASGSGVSPVMPSLTVPGSPFQGGFENLEAISRIFQNISNAKKTGADTRQIETLLGANLDKLRSEYQVNMVEAAYKDIQRKIDLATLPYVDKRAYAELKRTIAEYALAVSKNEESQANKLLTDIKQQFESKQLSILRQQEPMLVKEVEERVKLVRQQQKTEMSAQSANYASAKASESAAAKNYAEVKTINEVRPEVKRQAIALADQTAALAQKTGAEATVAWRTVQDTVDKLLGEINLTEAQEKYYRSQFDLAIKQKNWYDLNQIQGSLAPLTGVMTTILHKAVGPAKGK